MKDGRGYMQLIRMEVAAGSFSSAPLHLKCLFPLFLEMHLSVFPHCYHLNWTIDNYIDVSFLFDGAYEILGVLRFVIRIFYGQIL